MWIVENCLSKIVASVAPVRLAPEVSIIFAYISGSAFGGAFGKGIPYILYTFRAI